MKLFRSVAAVLTAAVLFCAGLPPVQESKAYDREVVYSAFPASVNGGEPIRGVDVSSIISIEEAGVVFHDDAGNEADLFRVLYDHDVNYIRVRVWNEPNDGDGHSYGGGNNDVNTACEIARRASAYGMKLLVDIQYSDFWADPAKQQRPKYWAEHDHDTLAGEIYKWTTWVLTAITEAGGDIGMVQVGNETNCHFCGETDMYQICDLFKSGDKAVRDFDSSILIAHHFANPSNVDNYYLYAKVLQECGVDYDVFATSYYPYWHGTTENLTTVLKTIGDTYGKYVMVAETAYPYTSDDGDTFGNVVSRDSAEAEFRYDISVDGQAQCLTDVFQAVADCGDKGLGVFYWEPAWLGVSGKSWQEQSDLWRSHGSGWATDYAAEYDPDVTQAGGSSYDNQALFSFDGCPLESLDVFTRILPKQEKPEIETTEPETEATQPPADLRTVEITDAVREIDREGRIVFGDHGEFRFAGDPHDADGRALSELRERDRVTIRFTYDALTGEIIEIEYLTIEPVRGDLNADRECGVTDVILLQKWLLRAGELPDAQSADLNADGTVDVFDLAMLKHLLFV
ncbi:MAG: glycosyl hydrolase 53 family protein [Oscillospiraceae bacterium]|nr:glycosyl hydrolase 53 family protein [Oscillospiraceae bacterium]